MIEPFAFLGGAAVLCVGLFYITNKQRLYIAKLEKENIQLKIDNHALSRQLDYSKTQRYKAT